jgi:hypothetical protein
MRFLNIIYSSVIVDDLDFCWPFFSPPKTNSELIIYSNTVLTSAVAFQGFQTVSGGDRKNSRVCAASSCASFRVAIFAMLENRLHFPVSNNACVSRHRKL